MTVYDVIIIGAGCTGCMTAYRLASYDLKVAVIEAQSDVAMGSTKANSAIAHAGFDAEEGTLKAKLNVEACNEMPELAAKLNIPYSKCGSLVIAFDEEDVKVLEKLKKRGETNGVRKLEIIGQDKLREMEPNISPNASAALYAADGGIVSAWGMVIAAAENAAVNGTDFRFNFEVNEITRSEDGIFKVSNGTDAVYGKYVVNAAGIYSDKIAVIAGEKDFPMTIIPRRGEYMLLDAAYGKMAEHTIFMVPRGNGKGILVSPTIDGNLIIGPNAYKIDSHDDKSTTAEGLAEITAGALKIMPSLNTRGVITQFSGIRPTPTTGDFYIKPSEQIKGLLHLAGIESPGLASSPAVGAYAVKLLGEMGLKLAKRENYIEGRPEQIRFTELSDEEKAAVIEKNPAYAKIICRCETITEGEIVEAIRRPVGARDLDGVKRRTRAGMGRCQGGFCSPRVTAIIARELGIPLEKVTKRGGKSYILNGDD